MTSPAEPQPSDNPNITEALVAELTEHRTRVCPIRCPTGETLKGDTCVADTKPVAAPATASRKSDESENSARSRHKQANRQQEREQPQRPKAVSLEVPNMRQQALARPSIISGSHTMTGVGF